MMNFPIDNPNFWFGLLFGLICCLFFGTISSLIIQGINKAGSTKKFVKVVKNRWYLAIKILMGRFDTIKAYRNPKYGITEVHLRDSRIDWNQE